MPNPDPYQTLGIPRTATPEAIRRAFRAIAKKSHPDLNPGDAAAEIRFKAANAAQDLLSDPERRARYDRGEIDAAGQEVPPRGYYRDHAESPAGARYRPNARGPWSGPAPGTNAAWDGAGLDTQDVDDLLDALYEPAGRANRPRRGADARYRLAVDFLDAVNGAITRLTLPDGATLEVKIPAGLEDGAILRLRGKGEPGRADAPPGDALIEIALGPHPFYRRDGLNLSMDVPMTIGEAVLGARIPVPTPRGDVTLTIPPQSDTGTQLRLRGRGVAEAPGRPAGDLLVTLKLVLGPVDDALDAFLRGWTPPAADDPRASLRRPA